MSAGFVSPDTLVIVRPTCSAEDLSLIRLLIKSNFSILILVSVLGLGRRFDHVANSSCESVPNTLYTFGYLSMILRPATMATSSDPLFC